MSDRQHEREGFVPSLELFSVRATCSGERAPFHGRYQIPHHNHILPDPPPETDGIPLPPVRDLAAAQSRKRKETTDYDTRV